MTENEKLIKNENDAIETINANMPKHGYEMLRESLEMAIKSLEEVQEYRKLGTVEELKNIQNKTISDLIKTIEKEFDSWGGDTTYRCEDETIIYTDAGFVYEWFQEYKEVLKRRYGIEQEDEK